jgi:multidrug efflux pump subunit AcrA (membrane-fusion protein)
VIKTVSANGQLAETQLLSYGVSEQPILTAANGSVLSVAQFGQSLKIESISVAVGDLVEKDDLLFTYLNPLGQEVEVLSISDGVVRSVDSASGLRTSGTVVSVGSDRPIISVFVSEYDADLVEVDQIATIELDAINAVFDGTVRTIGQVAQSVSGIKQYEVLLEVKKTPSGARFGMSATAEIRVFSKAGVLAIPMNALVGDEATQVELLRVDSDGNQSIQKVDIVLGVSGDSFIEVTSGLTEGDLVVTGISGSIPAPINFGPPPGVRQGG